MSDRNIADTATTALPERGPRLLLQAASKACVFPEHAAAPIDTEPPVPLSNKGGHVTLKAQDIGGRAARR